MTMIRKKFPCHEHPLYPTPFVRRCDYCRQRGGYRKDGYRCYECENFLHKECAETPLEVNHPSHPQHPLYLFRYKNKYVVTNCQLCGSYIRSYYYCTMCDDVVVGTCCTRNPPPKVITYPKSHEHSLLLMEHDYDKICDFCGEGDNGRYFYKCSQCQSKFHYECSNLSLEITHPCHPKHPLRLMIREEHHFSDGKCRICGEELGKKFYHCSICKFSVDVACMMDPPPLAILYTKAHEHQLNLMPRNISFTCDACGMIGHRSPYSCHQCDFMIHQDCIDLPEIINVNRHEHRLTRRIHLSPGSWVCGVCHKEVDWSYGAYSCSICSNYAIHTRCAIRRDVWEKLELKGIPEETQDIEPFKVIDENLICHFSHNEHYLKFNDDESIVYGGNICCAACIYPVYSQAFYSCVECDFVLHETCANLPKKKRHLYHTTPLTLISGDIGAFICSRCDKYFTGFRYTDFQEFSIDAMCGALSEPIIHESHSCPLYYTDQNKDCIACGEEQYGGFSCDDCKFFIDLKCVVLPKTAKHWNDEHLLSLCYDKNTSGGYWCDICEKEIDTKMKWVYTCDVCRVTFHTKCVLGDFSFVMPGRSLTFEYIGFECIVMQTDPGFLPRCGVCGFQNAVPFILKKEDIFVCSLYCLDQINRNVI